MKLSKKKNKDWYNLVICLLALSCPSSKDELNLQVMKVNLSWSYIRDKQAHYAIKMVKIWAHIFGGYKLWKTFWSLCCKIYGKLVKEIGLTKVPTNCASQYHKQYRWIEFKLYVLRNCITRRIELILKRNWSDFLWYLIPSSLNQHNLSWGQYHTSRY